MREVRNISKVIIESHRIINLNNFNKDYLLNKFMVENKQCPECNSNNLSWDEQRGEFYCCDCGTVIEDNVVLTELNKNTNFIPNDMLKEKMRQNPYLKPSRNVYNLNPNPELGNKSEEEKQKLELEKENFEIPRKIKEVLNYISELDGMIKNELPIDSDDKIFGKLSELAVKDYKEGLRSTQDKKAVVWATLLELIYKEIGLLNDIIHVDVENEEAKNKVIRYSSAIDNLEKNDKRTFDEAERIRSRDLLQESKNLLKIYDFAIPIDLEDIDISFNKAYKKGFHKLFSKGTDESWPDDIVWSFENTIRSEGISLARAYVFQKLINRINAGEKNPSPEKTTGLLCVCCYIACKKYNLNVKSQEEWASFFDISKSIFEKLFKEFKDLAGEEL